MICEGIFYFFCSLNWEHFYILKTNKKLDYTSKIKYIIEVDKTKKGCNLIIIIVKKYRQISKYNKHKSQLFFFIFKEVNIGR